MLSRALPSSREPPESGQLQACAGTDLAEEQDGGLVRLDGRLQLLEGVAAAALYLEVDHIRCARIGDTSLLLVGRA